jgi:hypothetical protein
MQDTNTSDSGTEVASPEPVESDERPAPARPGPMVRAGEFVGRHQLSLLSLLVYLLAGFMLHVNVWTDPTGLRIAGNPGDTTLYQWWFGWWLHALPSLQDPFTSYAMNIPQGVSLMNNTSMALPAILTSPIFLTIGPLFTYNLLSTLSPALTAWATYVCAVRFGMRPAAAFVGGLVFGFSPAILHSLIGHLSMTLVPLMPILVLLNMLAWRTTRPKRLGLVLGAVAFAQVIFQAGLATLFILIVVAISRPALIRPALPNALRTYGWAMVVFIPLAIWPLYTQFLGPLKMHSSPFWVDYFAADLGAFTTPSELLRSGPGPGAEGFPGGITEHLAYLGWPLLIVCVLTVAIRWSDLRVRATGIGLAVSAVLSMGGTLWVRGHQTEQKLPWAWLQKLPILESALPSRFGLLTALFAAAVLTLGLDALIRDRAKLEVPDTGLIVRRVVALLAATTVIYSLLPKLLPVEPVAAVPAYFTGPARELPDGTTALVVPFPRPDKTVALSWQTAARYAYATPGGYFIAPGADGHAYIGGPAGSTQQLLTALEDKGERPAVTPELRTTVLNEMTGWGIDLAILGPDPRQGELRQLMSELFQREPQEVGGVLVWERPAG